MKQDRHETLQTRRPQGQRQSRYGRGRRGTNGEAVRVSRYRSSAEASMRGNQGVASGSDKVAREKSMIFARRLLRAQTLLGNSVEPVRKA